MKSENVTTTLRWIGDWPWWVGLTLAAVLAITAWVLYRRDTGGMRPAFRILLPLLRALAIFLIVVLLAGPVLHHRKVIGELARLVVLVDGSESMQLADPGMDSGRKIQILERLGMLDASAVNLDLPQASATLAEARNLAEIAKAADATTADAAKKALTDFAGLIAKAESLFAKSSQQADQLTRFRAELGKPAADLGAREIKTMDDGKRAAQDLAKLGEFSGRWSEELATLFQKVINAEGANPAVKSALEKFDSLPRWQRVQALLLEGKPEQRLLAKLAKTFDLQLVSLENNEVKRVWQTSAKDVPVPTTLNKPAGTTTNLTSGLNFSVGSEQKTGKGAVLLITDGQQNAGESAVEAAKVLAAKKLPVFSLGTGSHVAPRDLAVLRVVAPDSVYHEDVLRGEIIIKEEVAANLPYKLTIKDGDKVVKEMPLISEGKPSRTVPFDFPVKELAAERMKGNPQEVKALAVPLDLKISLTPIEGERELGNNEGSLRFRAVTQKRKILLVDGRPRWETRYLKNLYQRDEKWEVNAAIAGMRGASGFIRTTDSDNKEGATDVQKERAKEGKFPGTKAELDAYELIIFGEVPKELLNPDEQRWLADFVGKRGGAIIFLDGARGHLRQYGDSPLGALLPVEYLDKPPTGLKSLGLTSLAAGKSAFALSSEIGANAEVWSKLPVPKSVVGVKPLPGAEVLIDADAAGGRVPLGILRPFGAGKVYYHAFDDSWRWRYEVADKYHVKFWNQIAGFVAEEPFSTQDKLVSLDAGKLTYEPGEQANIRVRIRNGEGKPVTDAAVTAVLTRDGKPAAKIELLPDEGGLYRGKTAALEAGSYEVAIESAAVPQGQIKVHTEFKVEASLNIEKTLLSVNEELLRQISLTSGGQYFREEQVDQIVKLLEPLTAGNIQESETPLLESWWWFALLVLLLTAEWLIRKRVGML
ncbi:MAG: hypothetical protein K8R23_07730 [Chthoniobacter sp.]|nr:hypothetical protein [Chthoniobacter sp.]